MDSQEIMEFFFLDWTKDGILQLLSHQEEQDVEQVFVKTDVEGEDILCCPREPQEGQDQQIIKTLYVGIYWIFQ